MPEKLNIEIIKNSIKKENITLVSTVYINQRSPLELFCKIHGSFFMNAKAIRKGVLCKKCSYKAKGANLALDIKTVKEKVQSLGYTRIWDCGKKRWEFNL